MDTILLPDWQAVVLALAGGMVMGWAMFRLLPGMKSDAYTLREWLPVAFVLQIIGWLTYFGPQFLYDQLDRGRLFITQGTFVLVLYATFCIGILITLAGSQMYRNRRNRKNTEDIDS